MYMRFSIDDKLGRLFYSFRLGEIVLICASNTYLGKPTRIVDLEKKLMRGKINLKHSTIQEHLEKLVKNSPVVSLNLIDSKKVGRERHLYFDNSKFIEYLIQKISLRIEYRLYDELEIKKIDKKEMNRILREANKKVQKLSNNPFLKEMVLNFLYNLSNLNILLDTSLYFMLDDIIDGLMILKAPPRNAPKEVKEMYNLIKSVQKYLIRTAAYVNIFNEFISSYKGKR